jgi:large subunit ribosomal protein L24e
MWTLAWRRLNKKGLKDEHSRTRRRRRVKVTRAVVGLNVDELKKRRNQRPEVRAAAREAALREVKERQKAAKKARKAAGKSGGAAKSYNKNRGKR